MRESPDLVSPQFRDRRPDGWPLCPSCGADELYALVDEPSEAAIAGCYRCAWRRAQPPPDVSTHYRPDDPSGDLYELVATGAWSGFIHFAWSNVGLRAQFTAVTGVRLAQKTPIEVVIDKATGYRSEAVARFVEWATVALYGLDGAPRAIREAIAAGTFVTRAADDQHGGAA